MLFRKPMCMYWCSTTNTYAIWFKTFNFYRCSFSLSGLNDRERKVSVILFVDVIIVCVRIKIQTKKNIWTFPFVTENRLLKELSAWIHLNIFYYSLEYFRFFWIIIIFFKTLSEFNKLTFYSFRLFTWPEIQCSLIISSYTQKLIYSE